MNESDLQNQELSEDEAVSGDRLVPVGEAIRYRKRAQGAEKEVSELSANLKDANSKSEQLTIELENMKLENNLVSKLASVGAKDFEAVFLLAKKRLETSDAKDVDSVVEQLMKDKEHLFVSKHEPISAVGRTSGVRQRGDSSRRGLGNIAQKAAASGNRVDVQEYMRARRAFL
jgi:hypothetical protein